jgi:hypothetical protein
LFYSLSLKRMVAFIVRSCVADCFTHPKKQKNKNREGERTAPIVRKHATNRVCTNRSQVSTQVSTRTVINQRLSTQATNKMTEEKKWRKCGCILVGLFGEVCVA